MKNKGFSLMEICVAIGLLGIMLSIGGPKIKNYIVVAQNMRAVATMETLRTASQLYYSETGRTAFSSEPLNNTNKDIVDGIKKLKKFLDSKIYKMVENGRISIGGAKSEKTEDIKINYGGSIAISSQPPKEEKENIRGDGIYLWFVPSEKQKYDHSGREWSSL